MHSTNQQAPQANNSSLSSTGVASDNGAIPQHTSTLETQGYATKPLSYAEMFLQSAQILVEQEARISRLEARLDNLNKCAHTPTGPCSYTIEGFASLYEIHPDEITLRGIEEMANVICEKSGIIVDTIADLDRGEVSVYPEDVLERAFNSELFSRKPLY